MHDYMGKKYNNQRRTVQFCHFSQAKSHSFPDNMQYHSLKHKPIFYTAYYSLNSSFIPSPIYIILIHLLSRGEASVNKHMPQRMFIYFGRVGKWDFDQLSQKPAYNSN